MRATALVVALSAGLSAAGQLPLPAALMDAKTVHLTSLTGVDRKTLGHVATEFRSQRRFELVADPDDADLLVTLMKQSHSLGVGVIEIPNAGFAAYEEKSDVYSLVAVDIATGKNLWANERRHVWSLSGTVKDLVKDLHKEIREAN